ncbi:hypothetical protein JS756_31205 [Streptomyces actuosus]|uniref:DUF222 domain-containing protein n=1 Tax=Streptomyces actuosus TaxID=1885 RepID=A0ABS2VZB8_STRAS|nr:hypothetical protein [Streptomyces actuosus]MBN0048491.1 hypothetical protein [Streptomyces actuosus]
MCARDKTNSGAQKGCLLLNSACVDAFVEQQVLAALTPAAVEVSLRAADQVLAERAELERLWLQRLGRAAQDADRARRSHHLAEPENRLVVRQLEKAWEDALAVQQQLREDYDRFARSSPRILTPAERQTITALAGDIEDLWRADSTTTADRKEIVRAVVDKVVVTVHGTSERVNVTIVWAGGSTTAGEVIRPVQRLEQLSHYPQLTDRIRELAGQGICASRIADLRSHRPRPHAPPRPPRRPCPPAPSRTTRRGARPQRVVAQAPGRRTGHDHLHPLRLESAAGGGGSRAATGAEPRAVRASSPAPRTQHKS